MNIEQSTISSIINSATEGLLGIKPNSPRLDAELLLSHVLECDRLDLILKGEQQLNTDQLVKFIELLRQRSLGCPVAYLTGEKEFWSLNLKVSKNTLIPRPDTETLVETAVEVFVANDPNAYLETCRMLGRCNQSNALKDISVPCEIVVGEEDYATPVAMAESMHQAIAGSNLTVIPKVRHLTPLEVPKTIARILLEIDID